MKLWLVGLGLALFCTISAGSECSRDFSEIQGRWYVVAVATECEHFLKHKEKMKMLAVEVSITEDNKLKINTNFPKKDGCMKKELKFEKLDDEAYVHTAEWGEKKMRIMDTDCETYAFIHVNIQKQGKKSTLVALYTKEPKLPDHLKEIFLERVRSLDFKDDQLLFPKEVACQDEA